MPERIKFKLDKLLGLRTDFDNLKSDMDNKKRLSSKAEYLFNICDECVNLFLGLEDKATNSLEVLSDDPYGLIGLQNEIERLKRTYNLTIDEVVANDIEKEIMDLKQKQFDLKNKTILDYVNKVINGSINDLSIYLDSQRIFQLLQIILQNNSSLFEYDKSFVQFLNLYLSTSSYKTYDNLFLILEYVKQIKVIANMIKFDSNFQINSIKNSSKYRRFEALEESYNKKR